MTNQYYPVLWLWA